MDGLDDSLRFLIQPIEVENVDSATLAKRIEYYGAQTAILLEEEKRREEARALALWTEAQEELNVLQAEREAIKLREKEILVLEQQARMRYEEGLRQEMVVRRKEPKCKGCAKKKKAALLPP